MMKCDEVNVMVLESLAWRPLWKLWAVPGHLLVPRVPQVPPLPVALVAVVAPLEWGSPLSRPPAATHRHVKHETIWWNLLAMKIWRERSEANSSDLSRKIALIFTTFWFLDVSCVYSYICHFKVCFEFRPETAELQIYADANFLLSRFFQQRKMRKSNQNELKSSRARSPHEPWHLWAHLEPTHPCHLEPAHPCHLEPTRAWTRPWRTRPWRLKPECATPCHVLNTIYIAKE